MKVIRTDDCIRCRHDRGNVTVVVCQTLSKTQHDELANAVSGDPVATLILDVFYVWKSVGVFMFEGTDQTYIDGLFKNGPYRSCASFTVQNKLHVIAKNLSGLNIAYKKRKIVVQNNATDIFVVSK